MPAITDLKTTWPMHKNGSITAGTHHLQVWCVQWSATARRFTSSHYTL